MSTFIQNATLLTLDGPGGAEPFNGSLLIEGDTIAAIGPDLVPPEGAEIIDGRGRLVMPGLVNSHFHSAETFFKGRYEHMPLEIWMLYAYPILTNGRIPERLLYLRTLIGAMESLKGGVTTMVDDFFDPPFQDFARHSLVFDAYEHSGIRARISNNVMDKHVLDTMPFLRELVPAELQAQIGGPEVTIASHEAYCKAAFAELHGRADRLYFMVSASAPQRVSVEFMQHCSELALRYDSPLHTHILETKTQAVTGDEFYGKTLIRHMHDIGVLHRNVTIAHSVWVTDDDMALMGEAGVSIAHNCVSNLKLGAGIAPIRRLIDAGVNVGLGTDGMCSNDTARIFDVMRTAGLVHTVATPEQTRLVSSREILKAATLTGARTALLDHVTGSLAVGKKADLIVLKMSGFNWTPLNDICHHLVYCENGSSIEKVMVAGNITVEDGRLLTVDEDAILEEVHELVPAWLAEHAEVERRNKVLEPYFAEMHRRATIRDIGINRYQGDLPLWQGQNRPSA